MENDPSLISVGDKRHDFQTSTGQKFELPKKLWYSVSDLLYSISHMPSLVSSKLVKRDIFVSSYEDLIGALYPF